MKPGWGLLLLLLLLRLLQQWGRVNHLMLGRQGLLRHLVMGSMVRVEDLRGVGRHMGLRARVSRVSRYMNLLHVLMRYCSRLLCHLGMPRLLMLLRLRMLRTSIVLVALSSIGHAMCKRARTRLCTKVFSLMVRLSL